MKFSSKLIALALMSLALAACSRQGEEQTLAREGRGSDAEKTGETERKLPECTQRNPDGTYKNGHGCSKEDWVEWQKAN